MEYNERISQVTTAHWFQEMACKMESDYENLHREARIDPQKSGHGAETAWKKLLEKWPAAEL